MVMVGTLIAESLAVGAVLDAVALTTTKISRADLGDTEAGQPETWTLIEFQAHDEDANRLADSLERSLRQTGRWYCDFRAATTKHSSCSQGEHSDTRGANCQAERPQSSTDDPSEYPRLNWTGRTNA
jgi:hypothetical protein